MKYDPIAWESKFELGVDDIDFQHHYFLDLVNRIAGELGEGENHGYQDALLAELAAYARFHFISEENMMLRAGFPGQEEHRRRHLELIDQLSVKVNFFKLGHSEEKARELVEFLVQWFIGHTTNEDQRFADFLKRQESSTDSS